MLKIWLTNHRGFDTIIFVGYDTNDAAVAQSVERRMGSAEVTGPIPVSSFLKPRFFRGFLFYVILRCIYNRDKAQRQGETRMDRCRRTIIVILWILIFILSVFIVFRERVPEFTEESQTAGKHVLSADLQPGDVVEQEFLPSQDWLESVSVAIDYSEQVDKENTKVLVEVLQEGEILQSQELALWVFDKLTFLRFTVGQPVDMDETVTIRVTNSTAAAVNDHGPSSEGTIEGDSSDVNYAFAMMTTDLEYLYLENYQNYTLNGVECAGRLFTNATYRVGFDYYPALTWVFWLLGGAAIMVPPHNIFHLHLLL